MIQSTLIQGHTYRITGWKRVAYPFKRIWVQDGITMVRQEFNWVPWYRFEQAMRPEWVQP